MLKEVNADGKVLIGDPSGIQAITDALCVSASLTRLDVLYNKLDRGGNGVQLLRDAVRQREGFALIDDSND